MRSILLPVLACAIAATAQTPSTGISKKELLRNDRLTAYGVEIKPGQGSPMHRHERDMMTIAMNSGELKIKLGDASPDEQKVAAGAVEFLPGGFSHSVENTGASTFRAVDMDFAAPQGKKEAPTAKRNHYCNEGSKTACVTEKYLFCTTKFCVEDVVFGPGAKSTQHSHDTEHMLVAITDYSIADDTTGKGVIQRNVKSGGVEYLPAGITHILTNTGAAEAHFIAIIFR